MRRVSLTGLHSILKSEALLPHFADEATGGECRRGYFMQSTVHAMGFACTPLTAVLGSTVALLVTTFAQMSSVSKELTLILCLQTPALTLSPPCLLQEAIWQVQVEADDQCTRRLWKEAGVLRS